MIWKDSDASCTAQVTRGCLEDKRTLQVELKALDLLLGGSSELPVNLNKTWKPSAGRRKKNERKF